MEVTLYTLLILAALVFLFTFIFTCIWLGVCHSCHYKHLIAEPEIAAPAQIRSVSVNRNHKIIQHSGKKLCNTRGLQNYSKHYIKFETPSQSRLSQIYEDIDDKKSICKVDIENQEVSYSRSGPEHVVLEENNSKKDNRNKNQNYSSFVHL